MEKHPELVCCWNSMHIVIHLYYPCQGPGSKTQRREPLETMETFNFSATTDNMQRPPSIHLAPPFGSN